MEALIQQKVLEVANQVEKQLDAELEQLEKLDSDDLEKLREKRLKELKQIHHQKQTWIAAVSFLFYFFFNKIHMKI